MSVVLDEPRQDAQQAPSSGVRPRRKPAIDAPAVLALCLAVAALAGGLLVSTRVFERLPHVEDEVAFIFQAKTIASGHLLVEAPPQPDFFRAPFIIFRNGHWYGKYLPGYPAVLALGALVDRVWLVNPLAGAGCVWLLFIFGRRIYSAQIALLAAALLVSSPFFLLQAGSLMSHVVSLAWTLGFLLLFEAARRANNFWLAGAAGLSLGMLFITRPLTAVGVAVPFAAWALVDMLRERRRVPSYLAMAGCFLPFVALLLLYNNLTTGNPFKSAYELWWPFDKIGFGAGIGITGHHDVAQGLRFTRMNVEMIADYLYGWPLRLSLLPATIAALTALLRLGAGAYRLGRARLARRRQAAQALPAGTGWDIALLAMTLTLVTVHVAYPTPGQMYGPRYYFEALPALTLLSARGIILLAGWLSAAGTLASRGNRQVAQGAASLAFIAVLLLSLHAATNFSRETIRSYRGWNNVNDSGLRTVEAAELENAVVFVTVAKWNEYAPFFIENTPQLDTNVIYAIDRGDALNRRMLADFPGRQGWKFTGGKLTRMYQ
ncbi:MAG: hypothetical protein DCC58_11160 [Chloroflexi bacterium]|nr:MAG: hypothetical protein DCC58_11160 [Chloroflexota bacterium]